MVNLISYLIIGARNVTVFPSLTFTLKKLLIGMKIISGIIESPIMREEVSMVAEGAAISFFKNYRKKDGGGGGPDNDLIK